MTNLVGQLAVLDAAVRALDEAVLTHDSGAAIAAKRSA